MSLQRISEFVEIQEGEGIFYCLTCPDTWPKGLTSGSFPRDIRGEQHHSE
jgi:phosphoribosyl-AMP cyclohydrolase